MQPPACAARILLGIVALGLFAFGLYSLIEARYRRIDAPA